MPGAESLTRLRGPTCLRLVYFVHDLDDPAVARRLLMLRDSLVSAVVIGFHRGAAAPAEVGGWPAVSLGRTADGRFGQRILAVAGGRLRLGRLRRHVAGANVVMARQLEMLVLANGARARFAATASLAYECLDIHRLLVAATPAGMLLRRLQGWLLRRVDLLVVSSPAFIDAHFAPAYGRRLPPVCVIENKVLAIECGTAVLPVRGAGPPWRIGWYGVLRCRRSLLLLAELARALPEQVLIELRGRPALAAIPDFHDLVAGSPSLQFLGPYDRRRDLPLLYGAVHFAWAIDFYEDGANSQWLLPNRLYEAGQYGAVPIALKHVQTGAWLAAHGAGLLLEDASVATLLARFASLQPADFSGLQARVAAVSRDAWVDAGQDGARLAAALGRHLSRH